MEEFLPSPFMHNLDPITTFRVISYLMEYFST
jgi:hypothetical protein